METEEREKKMAKGSRQRETESIGRKEVKGRERKNVCMFVRE